MNAQYNKRKAHIMKAIKKTQSPSNFLFFDTETRAKRYSKDKKSEFHYLWFGWTHYFRLEGGEVTREGKARFDTTAQFWKIVEKRLDAKRPLYIFAHNVCFDLTIVDFWRTSQGKDWDIDFFVLDDPPTMLGARYKGCRLYLIDTLNFWRCSLAELGKSLKFDKLEMPKPEASKEDWDNYCFRDVEILSSSLKNLIQFIDTHQLGKFGMTAPSLAMSAYKHRFMQTPIFIHDRLRVCELERKAYYGGMTEVFYANPLKDTTIYNLDVNSLYPYVMLNKYPVKLLGEIRNRPVSFLKSLFSDHAIVADVTIESKTDVYPKRVNNKFCMVRGQFRTALCGPELKRAFDNGHIAELHHVAWYKQAKIFTDYITHFWHLRLRYKQSGDSVQNTFCKLMMNSLYGKFGQRGFKWLNYNKHVLKSLYDFHHVPFPQQYETSDPKPRIAWGNEYIHLIGLEKPVNFRSFNSTIQIQFPLAEHTESFPLISAYVTSYGREYLQSLIRIAGKMNVYYCDTDSLFTNEAGYKRLKRRGTIDENELGKLKLEKTSTSARFYCPKDYEFGEYKKSKGIKRNAEQIDNGLYEQLQFEGVKSVLKRDPKPFIEIATVTKKLSRRYDKGVIGEDGWVTPLELLNNELLIDL